jgi:hypothetical protein
MSGRSGPFGWLTSLLMLAGLLVLRRMMRAAQRRARRPREPRVDSRVVSAGHETREFSTTPIVVGGVLLALVVGLAVVVATWFQASWVGQPLSLSQPPGLATPALPPPPPEPRLEAEPGQQLRQVRAAEDQVLTSTAWVDRQAGIVRIPIDRALDLLAANPPPARSAEEAAQYRDDASSLPSDASSGRVSVQGQP